ncbi:hypothetical protein GPECTOR_56g345 [Gonium pectorale]|uniref:Uncharacterized protein n=1 Tax=Gonium pectorale TaxID=33097 RepID=A0A150G5U0_GONPE|nr:hypothetical protein GPECTOR_56g345 [Gonium pectorale]|eukprot:KXZ45249.1 hypothetical protein GPECTOR_56g345 [Gonium pectorale]
MDGPSRKHPSIWIPSIMDRIARFLPLNEVVCSLRVVDKATAAMLRSPEFMTVRLSEPVPHHAFEWRWGRPGAVRDLRLAQRRELLLCLTAASGVTDNLALAASFAGRMLLTSKVSKAAGQAGQLGSCLLLKQLGCDLGGAVEGAAAGDHLALCEELVCRQEVRYSPVDCACAAAKGGHVAVLDFMVSRCGDKLQRGNRNSDKWGILADVAEGCGLATLQRLTREWTDEGEEDKEAGLLRGDVLAAAAGSPTPDWRAKVEWLESQGFTRTCQAFATAVEQPDALERFAWLAQRGYPRQPSREELQEPLVAAAETGNLEAVLFLAEGRPDSEDQAWAADAADAAAGEGHLHVLQALHAAGWRFDAQEASRCAAAGGHLHVVAWLVETPDLGAPLDGELYRHAARSGSVELVAWLQERDCPRPGPSGRTVFTQQTPRRR